MSAHNIEFTLPNFGNTCYLNTCVQCMMSSPTFTDYVMTKSFPEDTILYHLQAMMGEVVNDTVINITTNDTDDDDEEEDNDNERVDTSDNSNDTVSLPSYWKHHKVFVTVLRDRLKTFMEIFEQNDLGEFWNLFVDKASNEISQKIRMSKIVHEQNNLDNVDSSLLRLRQRCNRAWVNNFKDEYSPLVPMFHSLLISQISCSCGKIHHNYEFFNAIQVEIPSMSTTGNDGNKSKSPTSVSLIDCIGEFMNSFLLNDTSDPKSIEWTCDNCNDRVLSRKSFTFWRLPQVLVFNLKRFVFNERSGRFIKLNTPVEIPEFLDMKVWTLCDDRTSCKYRLTAIGCHMGSLNYGHYIALVRRGEREWVKIDDDDESEPFTMDDITKKNLFLRAYVCVYERF